MTGPEDGADAGAGQDRPVRVMIAYNSARTLEEHAAESPPGPTLIVDNASTDDTAETVERLGFDVLRLEQNVGFGMGAMAGMQHLDAEFVLILNPDVILGPETEAELMAAARRWPDCDLFVPRLIGADGNTFYRYETRFEPRTRDRMPPEGDCCIPMIVGAAMLIRRAPFIEFGGFDPEIFLFFEDDDIALRYARARRPVIFVHGAVAHHDEGSSSGSDRTASRIKETSFGWSRLYFGNKHFGRSGWRDLLGMSLKLIVYAVSGRRARLLRQRYRLTGAWAWMRGKRAPFRP